MFCSMLGAGVPVPGPPNDGGGGPAAAATCRGYRAHASASAIGRYAATASAVLR